MNKSLTFIVSQTYQTSTEESVELGGYEASGFDFENEKYSLEELTDYFSEKGFIHPSSSPISGKSTYITSERVEDANYFERGEETTFSLHLVDIVTENGLPLDPDAQDKLWNAFISKQLNLDKSIDNNSGMSL